MSRRRRSDDIQNSSQEAQEEQERVEQSQPLQENEEEGDDLMQDEERDYQEIQELDRYENQGLDDQIYEDDPEARLKAQQQINKRHRMAQIQMGDDVDELMDDDLESELEKRQKMKYFEAEDEDVQIDERRYLDAEENKGKLPQWIKEQETRKYIKSKFTRFLTQFRGVSQLPIYADKIRQMVFSNKQSLNISFQHLKIALPTIAMWIGLHPSIILPQLNMITYAIACKNYPAYKLISPEVFVKINDLPFIDHIRDLRHSHLGKLIRVKGVITIRSQVFSQMKKITYKCARCGQSKGPFYINNVNDTKLGSCTSCQSSGPFLVDKQKTIYRNYQKITVQESPSDVLPGRIPRSKEGVIYGDNIDVARLGDEVQITGIFINRYECHVNVKQGFPLFTTFIEINHIIKSMENEMKNYDVLKEEDFRKMAQDKNLDQKIYGSIAPSIYGHQNIKRALTLAMFGGQPVVKNNHKIRGDINVLLLGDPGTAKSQFLKSVQKVFHRCIYTTGKGASAVGLTASVKKDFNTNEWKLEAGALVLADKGICLIDQFDKMNENDRTSIHEAMEQQSISISKAGIVTSLRARCSVIAAANPVQGKYNSQISFGDNVELSEPILSRFDILNVVKDEVNEQIDHDLSTFVINSHIQNHPYMQKYDLRLDILEQTRDTKPYIKHEVLKHYIRYVRENCHPSLSEKNSAIIKEFYIKLRDLSSKYGGMNVSVRQMESIIRAATAHAKIFMRNEVEKEDVSVGINVLLQSFIQTQKHSTAKIIRKQLSQYL